MGEQKQSYYVNIQSHAILRDPFEGEWDVKIEATESQLAVLERLFDQNDETDWESFFRAQFPFLEYHHQPQNMEYDRQMQLIYTMLFYLGDEKTRAHIREMGILNEDNVNNREDRF
ncbi:hydrolase [Neobacillus novalis]|uniref:Hydrolase n=1 Tax=Neobacillus novalis TaxID=220687 RepID=A0AA95MHW2_9BACI|nr:hydrolase [Neobacillus novalis]WHY84067.1 hydrolase [Neobacillus novalis]